MSNEEKKDTVLQEEANKVAEDAAKEKAEAVDAQAADEGAAQAEPDANDGADKADAEKAAKFEQQFVRLQADCFRKASDFGSRQNGCPQPDPAGHRQF